jgi:hypothetical protein
MSEDSTQRPDEWKAEPGDRLTRLTAAALAGLQAHPEYGEDIRGIITLKDAGGAGSAMWGYSKYEAEPIYDLIRSSAYLFATLGIRLELSGDPERGQEPVVVPGPQLAGDGPHETVSLTVIVDSGNERLGQLSGAIKDAVESTGVSWGVAKLIIMATLDAGQSTILYHGLDDERGLVHYLLNATAQVTEASGGRFVMIPMGGEPN